MRKYIKILVYNIKSIIINYTVGTLIDSIVGELLFMSLIRVGY